MDIRNFFKKPASKDPPATGTPTPTASKAAAPASGKNADVIELDADEKKNVSKSGLASAKKPAKRRIESSSEEEVVISSSSSDSDIYSDDDEDVKPRKTTKKPPPKKSKATPPQQKTAPPVAAAPAASRAAASPAKTTPAAKPSSPVKPAPKQTSSVAASYFLGATPAATAPTTTPATSTATSFASSFFSSTPATATTAPAAAPTSTTFASPFAAKDTKPASTTATPAPAAAAPTSILPAAAPAAPAAAAPAPAAKTKTVPAWIAAKSRSGPPNKGNKPVPTGPFDCLAWGGGGAAYKAKHGSDKKNTSPLTFVISGVLDSLEREECEDLIKRHGGKVTGSVSGKTDYLVLGTEGGEKKKKDAESKGTKVIDEDGLFEIICKRAGLPFPYTGAPAASAASDAQVASQPSTSSLPSTVSDSLPSDEPVSQPTSAPAAPGKGSLYKRKTPTLSQAAPATATGDIVNLDVSNNGELLVDKYRPTRPAEIVGNNTNVESIINYLSNFTKHLKNGDFEQKNGPKRALLICGPPGTGKTSAVAACAKQLGMDVLEFNASDARAKSAVEQEIGNALRNKSLRQFGPGAKPTVVVMDECDGMSSSDRGGMAELIKCIKVTPTPVVCICNDAQATQIRSLKNYCETLTWRRVPAGQLAKHLCVVAKKEGVTVDPNAMEKVIEGARGDIRQVLNVIEMWKRGGEKIIRYDTALTTVSQEGKDLELGVFDVVPGLFKPPTANWLNDRLDSYFTDADIVPLFVQENYISAAPTAGIDPLQAIAVAADDISASDRVNAVLQRDQNYTLMPAHAYSSCVLPASLFTRIGGMLKFPALLGKMSTTNKRRNYLSMLKTGLWNHGAATSKDLATNTLWAYRMKWGHALAAGQVERVAQEMEHTDVGKDEWDAVVEFGENYGLYGMENADTKTKSALTRMLNKAGAGRGGNKVSKSRGGASGEGLGKLAEEGDDDFVEEDEEEEKEEEIKPVAAKKAPAKPRAPAKKKG